MSDEAEEWRAVVGDEGSYEVSNLGRVRSLDRVITTSTGTRRIRGGMMRGSSTGKKYLYVMLSGQRFVAIHVLVCRAFHGPKPGVNYQAAHFNGNSLDNRASNLRWVTNAENTADKRRHGRLVIPTNVKLTGEQVDAIRAERAAVGTTLRALGERYGVSTSGIAGIISRRTWAKRPEPVKKD